MKTKTRKLLAAITATAMLGSVLGVGAYAISKTDDGLGFKGTYNLSALAETATASTIDVMGQTIDTTSTLTLTSEDAAYNLYVTVIDTADMSALTDIKVGYTIGGAYYNAKNAGLSNVVYSSLTVSDGTVTAADLVSNVSSFETAKFVITEVDNSKVTGEATLTINGFAPVSSTFKGGEAQNSFFTAAGSQKTGETLVYKGETLTSGLKFNADGKVTFNNSLTTATTVTLGFANSNSKKVGVWKSTATTFTEETAIATATIDATNVVTFDLPANADGETYIIQRTSGESFLFYIEIIKQHADHSYTLSEVTKVPSATEKGAVDLVCSVGGETKAVELPVLSDESYTVGEPVITNDGHDISTPYTCTVEGVEVSFEVVSNDHAYDTANVTWTWSGTLKATATFSCTVCDNVVDVVAEGDAITNEAATVDGVEGTLYTATITFEGNTYTSTKFASADSDVEQTTKTIDFTTNKNASSNITLSANYTNEFLTLTTAGSSNLNKSGFLSTKSSVWTFTTLADNAEITFVYTSVSANRTFTIKDSNGTEITTETPYSWTNKTKTIILSGAGTYTINFDSTEHKIGSIALKDAFTS